jgi:hypothetical protein
VVEANLTVLKKMSVRMDQHDSPVWVAYITLLELDPKTPEPTLPIIAKAKEAAISYYAFGPGTSTCPYLLERAWLNGYAHAVKIELHFPHVHAVTDS